MSTRVDPFAGLGEPPAFATKPKPEKPIEKERVAIFAEEQGFPSRQAPRAPRDTRRKPRIYRTGRNTQFNAKATPETIARIYKAADERKVTLGRLLELAIDSLDAVHFLQKTADRRDIALSELVREALDALEEERRVEDSSEQGTRVRSQDR
jgi:hypothetical protein